MSTILLHAFDDPRIADYRDLPRSNLSRRSGRFIAEGETLVERLLASGHRTVSVLVEACRAERIGAWVPEEIPLYVAPAELLHRIVGFRFHRGVMACGMRPPPLALDQVLPPDDRRLTLVVCPDVQDPENLGGILRNSAAFGVDAVLLGTGCADPFSRRVLRVSMGTVLKLPLVQSHDLDTDLQRLKDVWNVQLAASVLQSRAEPLQRASRPHRLALLFGSEAHGLRPQWIEACQRRITLSMQTDTDSLNVSVASGVFLYHFTRSEAFEVAG